MALVQFGRRALLDGGEDPGGVFCDHNVERAVACCWGHQRHYTPIGSDQVAGVLENCQYVQGRRFRTEVE
jgi:hypothetical protein